jgi:hypothetical protein
MNAHKTLIFNDMSVSSRDFWFFLALFVSGTILTHTKPAVRAGL